MEVESIPLYTLSLIITWLQEVMLETFLEFIIHRHILAKINNLELITLTLPNRYIWIFLILGADTDPIDDISRKSNGAIGFDADVVPHSLERIAKRR